MLLEGIFKEVLIVLFLIFLNGLLAMAEMSIVSARKARLQEMADKGNQGARQALVVANDPTSFLATVQIGITLIGIFAGAFGGNTLAREIAELVKPLPVIGDYSHAFGMTLVVSTITLLSLLLGELVPKQIALQYAEKIAAAVAKPMTVIARFTKPLVASLAFMTKFCVKVLGIKENAEPPVTEAEITVLVEQATEAGVVKVSEQDMVSRVLQLDDRRVTSLMTPRSEVVYLALGDTIDRMLERIGENPHTHMPLVKEDLDHLVGVVELEDIMLASLKARGEIDLSTISRKPIYVPENLTALQLLTRFRDEAQQVAFVLDEYGTFSGIVTRDDILQAIAGTMPVRDSEPKWEVVEREDGSWLLDGQMPLNEFLELFHFEDIAKSDYSFNTLAGLLIHHMERIPACGDVWIWQGYSFEIIDMDRHRIDKILFSKEAGDDSVENPVV